MSFGPSAAQQNTNNTSNGITSQALTNSTAANANGSGLLNLGGKNVQSGTNFFNSVLNGNSADTAATLQPSIDQIRNGTQQNIQQLSTLQPRGGGRSSTLFNASYAPQSQIQNLFNGTRTSAATTLPQIGLQQQGLGTNLFNVGNSSLSTGSNTNANLAQSLAQQQQLQLQQQAGLGAGLFGLLTTPFGTGAGSKNGLLGLI